MIEENTIIGDNTTIGHNVILGSKGLQLIKDNESYIDLTYSGGVKIGKFCQIGEGVIVVRPFQPYFTSIHDHVRIGPMCSIGHLAEIGSYCTLSARITVAGHAIVCDNVWIGAGAVVSNKVVISKNSKVLIGSVVIKNVAENAVVSGNFATDHIKNLKRNCK